MHALESTLTHLNECICFCRALLTVVNVLLLLAALLYVHRKVAADSVNLGDAVLMIWNTVMHDKKNHSHSQLVAAVHNVYMTVRDAGKFLIMTFIVQQVRASHCPCPILCSGIEL